MFNKLTFRKDFKLKLTWARMFCCFFFRNKRKVNIWMGTRCLTSLDKTCLKVREFSWTFPFSSVMILLIAINSAEKVTNCRHDLKLMAYCTNCGEINFPSDIVCAFWKLNWSMKPLQTVILPVFKISLNHSERIPLLDL
jgi:hypothetical protein